MNNQQPRDSKPSFWSTLPGIITTISGLIVAITGLITVFNNRNVPESVPRPTSEAVAETTEADFTKTPESMPTQEVEETETPTATSTQEVEATQTNLPDAETTAVASPTPTTELEHVSIPDEPANNPAWFPDSSSLIYASLGYSTADDFNNHPLERPFTAEAMEYVGYTDIKRAEISSVRNFIYISIGIEMPPPDDAMVYYGIEIDADEDGRGDWLVYAQATTDTEWTIADVQIYYDEDGTVGGPSPVKSNPGIPGNGYEVLLFDSGYLTDDPDMAWTRRDPTRTNYIQIAIKSSVIENDKRFLWSVWADAGPMQPGWFDYNDHFTLEEAGSPIQNAPDYPLRELALVDSTCRWPFGFNARGDEPGYCQ